MANIIKHLYTITYEMSIDTETGEIVSTKIVEKSKPTASKTKSDKPKDDNPDPILTLGSNKFTLNTKAIELLGVNVGDKIDINYEHVGTIAIPVIGKESTFGTKTGTKLTKAGSCSYRGVKNEELASHGTEFKLIAHETKPNMFVLSSGESPVPVVVEDSPIEISEEADIDFDSLTLDINKLVEDSDDLVIESNFFKL